MKYNLHLNLQQRAALRIAITIWETRQVKDKAVEVIRSFDGSREDMVQSTRQTWSNFCLDDWTNTEKWCKLTKTVVDEWNKDVLPQKLEVELIHFVKMIGEAIFNWYRYIEHNYVSIDKAINCLDEIKWTPYGTVDVVQTFKSSWLNNPNLDIMKIYNFACRYTISDHINELWNQIPHDLQKSCYGDDIYRDVNKHILAFWKCCHDNDLPNLIRYFQVIEDEYGVNVFNYLYDLNRSTEENMLRLTVFQGHFLAMKYFWDKLTEEERAESVVKCAHIAQLRYYCYESQNESIRNYKMCQYLEIWVFLINQMTNTDKKLFFNQKFEWDLHQFNGRVFHANNRRCWGILKMLVCTWPWQELFIPVLEDILHYVDDDTEMDPEFLHAITSRMCMDYELRHSVEHSKYRFLLREAWLIIPARLKRNIVLANSYCSFMGYLIDVWDLDSVNLILNDPEIVDVRDQFIDLGHSSYRDFVCDNQFEKLDQLMEAICRSEEEKKSFKQKINPWYHIFMLDKFDLADKFLDWQSSTPEERRSLKNNINHMEFCEAIIVSDDFELFYKLLDWKFETIEERKQCEDHFKEDIFVIKEVYQTWREHERYIEIIELRCSKFLGWVFESNEEIERFKKEKLVNFEIDPLIIDGLVRLYQSEIIDEFLSWCLLNDREIQRIKLKVSLRIQ